MIIDFAAIRAMNAARRHNPNCDGGKCSRASGEVRRLPLPGNAGLILCRSCYENEMNFRRSRNRELAVSCQFPLPTWESLEIYEGCK